MTTLHGRKLWIPAALALLAAAACNNQPGRSPDAQAVDRGGAGHSATPTPAAATRTLQYYGGPVIPNPKVTVVWWGDPANLNSAITAAHGGIADFFAGVTNSNYVDWLNEYNTTINAEVGSHVGSPGTNQRIGRGNYLGTTTLTGVATSGTVTDAQIQSALNQAFAAGTLPRPDENSIYAVYFPRAVTITASDGSTSCSSFGAYHDAAIETSMPNAFYLVMPDCGDSFSGTTNVTSHELVEAMTDGIPTPGSSPNYPQAWNNSTGSEAGDLCQSSSGTISTAFGSFTVQGIWDERSQSCKTFTSAAQDFNLSVSPNTATVAASASTNFTVQTATSAGAAESLTLSVTAPAGVTASINPTSISSGQTATLTVTASSSAAPSGLQVIVRADGSGGTHTAALLLSVGGAANDFGLSVSPASITVAPGSSGSYNVTTTLTSGTAQPVSLSVSGLPAGATGSFNPTTISAGQSSTLTVNVGSGASAGNSTLTISGTDGTRTHTAAATLVVSSITPPPGGGLTNGGFETGDLSGWTASGASASASTTAAHSGSYGALLGSTAPTNGDSSIAQTFTAPSGGGTLSFWYKVVCPDSVTYDWATATLKDNTAGTTATVLAKTCTNTGAWAQATASVVSGHSYTLTLTNHDDNYSGDATYTAFDDVQLPVGPPPPPTGTTLVNGNFASGLSGWTVSGTCTAVSGGAQCGSTSPTNGDSAVAQTFTIGSSATTLAFTYAETCPDSVTYDWATATLKDNVTGTTSTLLAKTCTTGGTTVSTSVAASAGHSVTLTLTNHDDNYSGDATYTKFSNVTVQ